MSSTQPRLVQMKSAPGLSLIERMKETPKKSVVLVKLAPDEDLLAVTADFLRYRASDKGIYVSSNRPIADLMDRIGSRGFDMKQTIANGQLFVVDLASRMVGGEEVQGVLYVAGLSELSATQLGIEKGFQRLGCDKPHTGQPWLFLDSISTLLIYNNENTLLQFLHFLVGRLRVLGVEGIIVTANRDIDRGFLASLRQFCDIEIDQGEEREVR
jgi:archaellum biogenesis ATPase FlaH